MCVAETHFSKKLLLPKNWGNSTQNYFPRFDFQSKITFCLIWFKTKVHMIIYFPVYIPCWRKFSFLSHETKCSQSIRSQDS